MQVPPSPDMAVSMSLVNKLQNRQSRFEINWAHGSFMDDIPKRTSHSVALTVATQAFMLALPCAEVSHTLSLRRLRSYTAALRATRLALLHPAEAYTLNTLCAVYLLWICQVSDVFNKRVHRGHSVTYPQSWTAIEDDTFVHQKGIASLLNQNLRFDATNQFDRGVIYVACTVVVRIRVFACAGNRGRLTFCTDSTENDTGKSRHPTRLPLLEFLQKGERPKCYCRFRRVHW